MSRMRTGGAQRQVTHQILTLHMTPKYNLEHIKHISLSQFPHSSSYLFCF